MSRDDPSAPSKAGPDPVRVQVARLTPGDASELLAGVIQSRRLHHPWVAPPDTLEALQEYLGQPSEQRFSYGVRNDGGGLTGVVNISSIIRAAFQNGFLGFYALSPHEGRGYMRAGLAEVIDLAFDEHGLHRLESNVQPGNHRSAGLVRALGFRLEGHSPRYLRIDGDWRDHDRYALTLEDWGDSPPPGDAT